MTRPSDQPAMGATQSVSESQLHRLFAQALTGDLGQPPGDGGGLRLLRGFNPNLSGAIGVYKVFAAASCSCGTAAVLSVEVERSKTYREVEEALPSLMDQLRLRERAFRNMPCSTHAQMRSGGLATVPPVAPPETPESSEVWDGA